MWKSFTGVLYDGLKEFKEAIVEDTPPSTPNEVQSPIPRTSEAKDDEDVVRHEAPGEPPIDSSEAAVTADPDQTAPIESLKVPANSKEQASFENWEMRMLENEITRLRAEIDTLKTRNKELEQQCNAISHHHACSPREADSLHEENKLLKKAMKQLMNKLVPPPEKAEANAEPTTSPNLDDSYGE